MNDPIEPPTPAYKALLAGISLLVHSGAIAPDPAKQLRAALKDAIFERQGLWDAADIATKSMMYERAERERLTAELAKVSSERAVEMGRADRAEALFEECAASATSSAQRVIAEVANKVALAAVLREYMAASLSEHSVPSSATERLRGEKSLARYRRAEAALARACVASTEESVLDATQRAIGYVSKALTELDALSVRLGKLRGDA